MKDNVKPPPPRYRRYTAQARRAMLVDAALACLAREGIAGFTIDRICAQAQVSRGLITHHFKSKEGLLVAVYAAAYDQMLEIAAPDHSDDADLVDMVDALLSDDLIDQGTLRAWLALWGEVANNPTLIAEHRRYYDVYYDRVVAAIRRAVAGRTIPISEGTLASIFIALADGLWLERCIDPDRLSRSEVRNACFDLLEAFLGPLDRSR